MAKEIQLIKVKRVFRSPNGTFEFQIIRASDLYWHVDVLQNQNSIASYNIEISGSIYEYITNCDEFYQCHLCIEQEVKRLQEMKWHITVDDESKYNLRLTDINNATQQFRAVLIDENDNVIRQRYFNVSYYDDVEYLFDSLV